MNAIIITAAELVVYNNIATHSSVLSRKNKVFGGRSEERCLEGKIEK